MTRFLRDCLLLQQMKDATPPPLPASKEAEAAAVALIVSVSATNDCLDECPAFFTKRLFIVTAFEKRSPCTSGPRPGACPSHQQAAEEGPPPGSLGESLLLH